MFVCEFEPAFALGVMLFGLPHEERDFEQYVEMVPKLDKRAETRQQPTLLIEFAAGYPPPNALWRRRFVEARAHLVSKPLVALVVPSVAMRAGVALARWVRAPTFEQHVCADVQEAFAWLEERRGAPTKVLQALYAEATAKLSPRTPDPPGR